MAFKVVLFYSDSRVFLGLLFYTLGLFGICFPFSGLIFGNLKATPPTTCGASQEIWQAMPDKDTCR